MKKVTESQWYPCLFSNKESILIQHGKNTDHLEKPSSLCPSLHRQCEFKSPQIRATQAVSRDQKKENWHLLFVLSPPGSIEKIQPKEPNPAFQVNILGEKKKRNWFGTGNGSTTCSPASTHSFASLQELWGRALPAQACKSQQVHPEVRVRHLPRGC